jgi:hypothetical protein
MCRSVGSRQSQQSLRTLVPVRIQSRPHQAIHILASQINSCSNLMQQWAASQRIASKNGKLSQ